MGSSPFPEGLTTAKLHVAAGSPLAEVFLIDHQFALKERSIGDLNVEVEPGVYNVKARLGDATVEQLVVLNKDQELDLRGELAPAASAPIEGALPTQESAVPAKRIGKGAEVFLSTRSEKGQSQPVELSLHRANGRRIEDLKGSRPPLTGRTLAVDPGSYFLRWKDSTGIPAEQSVQAVRGWQTQVFMLDEAGSRSEPGRHHVSVQMCRRAFDPANDMLRRTEEARAALAEERKVASTKVNRALFAKSDNPILGLFGAHLMLLAQDAKTKAAREKRRGDTKRVRAPVGFDQSLFDTAVGNLRRLLGAGNPDVVALSTKTSAPPKHLKPLSAPPMLWRSWLLLVEASNDRHDLVPLAVCRQVAKLLPVRPFLVWSPVNKRAADRWEGQLEEALAPAKLAQEEARSKLARQLLIPRVAIDQVLDSAS
jgi:hypothetical protein